MFAFQIGRINGYRWTNMIPPIQGGSYRPYHLDEDAASSADSSDASRPPSPVFEPAEQKELRRRASSSTVLANNAIPSQSTAAPAAGRPAWMDARTQEQIDIDHETYPSLDTDTQARVVEKYHELGERIAAAGLYECNYWNYFWEVCRYSLLGSLSALALHYGWYCTSGILLGMMWHLLVFSAHDSAHIAITHRYHVDSVIAILIADYIGGLSIGWWKRNHNVHHIVTNSPEHDPDIQHVPFFAVTHRFFDSLRSSYYGWVFSFDRIASFFISRQHYLYYPILAFGRFNLYRLSWIYLLSPGQAPRHGPAWWHRWLELGGQAFFWYWYGYATVYSRIPTWGARLAFVLLSHIVTSPLHVQITISHFGMSTSELSVTESFPQKQLRTTMDIDCPPWMDFYHGGLQYQAVHHLFPRIPRHNLRAASYLVMDFARETGIPYVFFTFVHGNRFVLCRMSEVARLAGMFETCRRGHLEDLKKGKSITAF